MKVVLIGGSGGLNYGDELIALGWLRYLHGAAARANQPLHIHLCNNSVATSKALFAERFPSLEFSAALKRHPREVDKGRDSAAFMRQLQRGSNFLASDAWRSNPELVQAIEAMCRADVIHLYGGGYINTWISPHGAFLIGVIAAVATAHGVKAVASGLGVTPLVFEASEDLRPLRDALNAFDVFEVRAEVAATRLRKLLGDVPSVCAGLDDVYLDAASIAPVSEGRRLHLSAFASQNILELPAVLQWLEAHRGDYIQTLYWLGCPRTEQALFDALQARCPWIEPVRAESLIFEGMPVAPGDHMLTMRYHPHLMAARAGAVGQFVSHNRYYDHKHGEVLRWGSPFTQFAGQPAMPADHRTSAIVARDGEHMAAKRAVAAQMYRF